MMNTRKPRSPKRQALFLMAPELRRQWPLIAVGVLSLLLEVGLRVLEPWPLKMLIDNVLTPSLGVSGPPSATDINLLFVFAGLLVATVALRALTNYLATVCFAIVGSRVAANLRARVFRHVHGLDQQFHAQNRSADTVQRIVSDVSRLQEVGITAGFPLIANTLTLLVMLVVMFMLDMMLAGVVIVTIILFFIATYGSSRRITSASRRSRKGEGQLANTAQESLASIKVVQTYGLESHIEERFIRTNKASLKEGVKTLRLAARLERTTDVIIGIASAAVMIGGGWRVLNGDMTLGELVLFTTYLRTTMKPLRDMAKYTGRIAKASASGERVYDLMSVQSQIVSPEQPLQASHLSGDIELKNVSTAYEGRTILKNVNVHIRPGQYVAIIGPSGSGKSTFVSLLTRGQDPITGRVLMDGKPVTELDLTQLRDSISTLHQEAVLFAGTIRENIRMGRLDATDEEIEAAARAANAAEFIEQQSDGYDTIVGERGSTLSGGQRQRIAIARAFLRNSPMVILDEATTGLDPESSTAVLEAIDTLVKGRTTLAVTHDAEVVLRADRVLWIQDGQILLDASPTELAKKSETFQQWLHASGRQVSDIRVETP